MVVGGVSSLGLEGYVVYAAMYQWRIDIQAEGLGVPLSPKRASVEVLPTLPA